MGRTVNVGIVGPNSGADMVRFLNSSTASDVAVNVEIDARVMFTDTSLNVMENWLSITDSNAIFERASIYSEYSGYYFKNSTIIATNTSFSGGHNQFSAYNSVLNFTNSSVSIA